VKLKFDGTQRVQIDAVASIADLFDDLVSPLSSAYSVGAAGELAIVPNGVLPSDEDLLSNLRSVQTRNGLALDDALKPITRAATVGGAEVDWSFPNFSVEMETGTGKTYVYLRTALELSRRYGFKKYIVVVPTIAICQGVVTMLRLTREHFADLYPDVRYGSQTYDSRNLGQARHFVLSPSTEFLIMTLDSFNKSRNVIYRRADRLQGEAAISLLQAARPILILDEPQNMGSEIATHSLGGLTPLFALRYSATHRDPYNLVYRLTPLDAYRLGLVKQIEVAGIERELDANRPFVHLESIDSTKKRPSAALSVHVLRAGGGVRQRRLVVRPGIDLRLRTKRPEYGGYIVEEVNPAAATVRFSNNLELTIGESTGVDRSAIFASQIRYTIREHLLRQERLRSRGIKVLSLFFVDQVLNYEGENPVIRNLFDVAFEELKQDFDSWKGLRPADVRAAYFASRRRRGGRIEYLNTGPAAATEDDKKAFELIMKDKEGLLSFDEPVAFIFSHSALREGWDNPNVCQICTLNQSISEIRKRQEIGRGIRLVVDQSGARVSAPECNVLTVVANESYERYVARYQKELTEDLGADTSGTVPANARQRREVRLRKSVAQSGPFGELWERIRRKTRYSVRIDTEALLAAVVPALDDIEIQPVRVQVSKGRIIALEAGFEHQAVTGTKTLDRGNAKGSVEDLIETTLHLLEHGSQPCRVTRRTVLQILLRSRTKAAALANPHGWATTVTRILREKVTQQLVEGIAYEPLEESHSLESFDEVSDSWEDRVVESKLGLYDHVVVDSNVERRFVQSLERDSRTMAYVKLPNWYRVETPVGSYNPDWAVAQTEQDEHGQPLGNVYFVAETKALYSPDALRLSEQRKISCGRAHFDSLGVRFEVVTSLADLDRDSGLPKSS